MNTKDDQKLAKNLTLKYGEKQIQFMYEKNKCYTKSSKTYALKLNLVNAKNIVDIQTRMFMHEKLKLEYIRQRVTESGRPIWWVGVSSEENQQTLLNGGDYSSNGLKFYFSEWRPYGVNKLHFCENCLMHTKDMKHKTHTCQLMPICPNCAGGHKEPSGGCQEETLCRNCSQGMDDHRADTIDCADYRKTFEISEEIYLAHLKVKEITNATRQNENIEAELAEINENSKKRISIM